MKVLFVLCLFGVSIFFDCSSHNRKQTVTTIQTALQSGVQNLLTFKNKVGDVEYTINAKLLRKGEHNGIQLQSDVIQIKYELKNTGGKSYLIFNRGHLGTDDSVVYVEPQSDGTVEISQKAFREPKDKKCPYRYVPIVPNASWLKSKQTVHNQIEVALPLKIKTPFDDCTPPSEIPVKIDKTKFCVGISEADAGKVKINNKGLVEGWQYIKEQQLLCSDTIELK
ncbi:MAG: hypothetical protein H0W76_16050 [Pyrinomonadaceae bacterium]|nr:hypothetical protein [Pyrinomonadaceae bacterium]